MHWPIISNAKPSSIFQQAFVLHVTPVSRVPRGNASRVSSVACAYRCAMVDLSCERLCEIAAGISSDIPALVMGGPVLMEGRGEVVHRIDAAIMRRLGVETLPAADSIEVFCPGIISSTHAVYREFKESDCRLGPNDLQPAALRLYPEIADALAYLEDKGLKRVTMSGSGSAVYGVKAL